MGEARGRSRDRENKEREIYKEREKQDRKERYTEKEKSAEREEQSERQEIQSQRPAGEWRQQRSCLLSMTGGGGGPGAHACAHAGPATEPPCQGKHVSPGMGMSRLLSPPAAQDLQAFEMQD